MPNVEALLKVVEILEATPDELIDLSSWTCLTTACAIGHAAQHPWFIERGFKLSPGGSPLLCLDGEQFFYWDAVEQFFGLKRNEDQLSKAALTPSHKRGDIPPAFWLFNVCCYVEIDEDNVYNLQQQVGIKQQVINRIKKFVHEL